LKLIPPVNGTRPLGVRKEISSGIDKHLLFTIYTFLFTIVILTANRWLFKMTYVLFNKGIKMVNYN